MVAVKDATVYDPPRRAVHLFRTSRHVNRKPEYVEVMGHVIRATRTRYIFVPDGAEDNPLATTKRVVAKSKIRFV